MANGKKFSHRANRDGTIDSICLQCFRTVFSTRHEAALDEAERDHVCEAPIFETIREGKDN